MAYPAKRWGRLYRCERIMSGASWGGSEYTLLSEDEARRRLYKYCGVPSSNGIPKEKSTKLAIRDFQWLAGIDYRDIDHWLHKRKCNKVFGETRMRRLTRALWLADNGHIQKIRYRKYIIHEEPFVPPKREMKVNIGISGVGLTHVPKDAEPNRLPGFLDVFRRIK